MSILHHEVGADRQERPEDRGPFLVLHRDPGLEFFLAVLDNHPLSQPGHLIHLFVHRHALDHIPDHHPARGLRENHRGEGIPFRQRRTRGHLFAVLHLQSGPVDDLIDLLFAPLFVHDRYGAIPVHDDQIPGSVSDRPDSVKLYSPRKLIFQGGLLRETGCGTTNVERPHGELRPWLAD